MGELAQWTDRLADALGETWGGSVGKQVAYRRQGCCAVCVGGGPMWSERDGVSRSYARDLCAVICAALAGLELGVMGYASTWWSAPCPRQRTHLRHAEIVHRNAGKVDS